MTLKITILGSGGSMGVPIIGGYWGKCNSKNPKNYRTRASILVEINGKKILIDTSPDLRIQLLQAGIAEIDAVLYTHAHADHIHGINDLRPICRNRGKALDIYADPLTLKEIKESFAYAFTPNIVEGQFFKPVLIPHEINGPFEIEGVKIIPIIQDHGFTTSLGFRINDFAYSTDVLRLDDKAQKQLLGLKLWVVDCFRFAPHNTHSSYENTLQWIRTIKPQKAILTHLSEDLDYEALLRILPPHIKPGYDGLVIEL